MEANNQDIKVFKSTEEIVTAIKSSIPEDLGKKFLAFYSSQLGGIITDPAFMSVCIFDHLVVRGHAVFDTTNVINGKLYQIDNHINRFFKSMDMARIKHPVTKEQLKVLIKKIASIAKEKDIQVRYWASSGVGPLEIVNQPHVKPSLFLIALRFPLPKPLEGVNEFTVDVPVKPKLLANIKTNNYLLNVLCAMSSKEKGGHLGVQVDPNGYLTESSIANVMFYTKDKDIISPELDTILEGKTITRMMDLLKEQKSKYPDDIRDVKFAKIHIDDIKQNALEMVIIGGDKAFGVSNWDGVPLPNGNGKITKLIQRTLYADWEDPQQAEPVDYDQ